MKNQVNIKRVKGNVYAGSEPASLRLDDRIRKYKKGDARTYYFGSDLLGFYGREAEKQALAEFIESQTNNLGIWMITGVGGTGKSKLAFEVCNTYRRNKGYYAGFLAKNAEPLPADWSPKKPTLIVIDYAADSDRTTQIEQFVSMYESARKWKHPVRILLIERGKSLLDDRLSHLPGTWHETFASMLHKQLPLDLEPLTQNDILKIMRHILGEGTQAKRQTYQDSYLWELFKSVDEKQRTLFAIYLAETLRDHDPSSGPPSGASILNRIYNNEVLRWKDIAGDKYDMYMHLAYLATLMGGCNESVLEDKGTPNVLPDPSSYTPRIYEQIIGEHLAKDGYISPLEPDIFGEYALLRIQDDAEQGSRGAQQALAQLRQLAWRRPETAIYVVIYRTLRDFPNSDRASLLIDKCLGEADTTSPAIELVAAVAWHNRGIALVGLNRFEEAIQAFDKALAIDPKLAEAWGSRGIALEALNRFEEAIQAFDKALAIDPKLAEAWGNKGVMLKKLNRFEEAIQAFDKALAIDPKLAEAWGNKGVMLHHLKRLTDADAAMCEAIKLFVRAVGVDAADTQKAIGYLRLICKDLGLSATEIDEKIQAIIDSAV